MKQGCPPLCRWEVAPRWLAPPCWDLASAASTRQASRGTAGLTPAAPHPTPGHTYGGLPLAPQAAAQLAGALARGPKAAFRGRDPPFSCSPSCWDLERNFLIDCLPACPQDGTVVHFSNASPANMALGVFILWLGWCAAIASAALWALYGGGSGGGVGWGGGILCASSFSGSARAE